LSQKKREGGSVNSSVIEMESVFFLNKRKERKQAQYHGLYSHPLSRLRQEDDLNPSVQSQLGPQRETHVFKQQAGS
jgi:hypothetical protein